MPSGTYRMSVSSAGVTISASSILTADSASGLEVMLPVAWPITSWVKTDADTATGNFGAGHGQVTGVYDIYWSGGERLGVTVTITVNAGAFEGGVGTDFPASATAVVACKQTAINAAIDGDEAELVALSLEYVDAAAISLGNLDFQSAALSSIETVDLAANTPQVWTGASAVAKFTGAPITDVIASHNNTILAATLKIVVLQDVTPGSGGEDVAWEDGETMAWEDGQILGWELAV